MQSVQITARFDTHQNGILFAVTVSISLSEHYPVIIPTIYYDSGMIVRKYYMRSANKENRAEVTYLHTNAKEVWVLVPFSPNLVASIVKRAHVSQGRCVCSEIDFP